MSRRASLPGADELFRATAAPAEQEVREEVAPPARPAPVQSEPARPVPARGRGPASAPAPVVALAAPAAIEDAGQEQEWGEADVPRSRPTRLRATTTDRRPTGRERHDEKITVYVSAEELIDLEHARLALRREHGLAIDRGRIVREALAVVLADLEAKGESSILVRRLRGR